MLVQFIAVIFSLSATFAVVMPELFVGLFPVSTVSLFRHFEFPMYVAIAVFFLHIFSLYTYWYQWDKCGNGVSPGISPGGRPPRF
ncbi:MAG: hypothetical protein HY282_15900 [Nitrospirae bacterium]|nr:hypothetical protein [Candidatus Manganitrophaceae bacterium]